MVNNWIDIIQDYLLPPTCILCGGTGLDSQDICLPCYNDLHNNHHCCYRCAAIFETVNSNPMLCGQCISQSPDFDETHAPYQHTGIIRYLIAALKFKRQYKNARLLAYLLGRYLEQSSEMPELIIPVPLHKMRFRERGFNQSIEIAKAISRRLNIPLDTKACIRKRNTPHQIDLPAKQRHKNIRNAFEVCQPIHARHVAILDDVMTTGSTANELAKVLKKAGVSRVDVWVCARA